MERIPGYNELLTHTEDNFFPEELENYGLNHRDKVLLTLRLIRGVRYEDAILEDLTENGQRAYRDLFLKQGNLTDDSLIDILFNLDTIEEIIKFRASSSRVYNLTEDPKIVQKLAEKFYEKLKENGSLIDTTNEFPEPPKTFSRFLEWYGKSTFNTMKCTDFHGIVACLKNATQTQNQDKTRTLTRRFLNDETSFDSVLDAFGDGELSIQDLKFLIDSEPDQAQKKNILERIFVFPMNARYIMIESDKILEMDYDADLGRFYLPFLRVATEVDADLHLIFVNNNIIRSIVEKQKMGYNDIFWIFILGV